VTVACSEQAPSCCYSRLLAGSAIHGVAVFANVYTGLISVWLFLLNFSSKLI